MKFYFAPMEGLTGYLYRKVYHTYFNNIDKFFSPFIATNQNGTIKNRDLNDILPENNQGIQLIPQVLSNNAHDFIEFSKQIKQLGYDEINLNLGCPSGTVVSKNKGSGFLAQREELDAFLSEIYAASVTKISIKTRIGKEQPEEFYDLMQIYNKYPIHELIIHPRVRKDFYKNKPNLLIFKEALKMSKLPICYNGDIFTVENYKAFIAEFPEVETVMLGRGLIANPGLVTQITENIKIEKSFIKEFHDYLYKEYKTILFGDRNVLFKMKEIWFYMFPLFSEYEKYAKKIRKAERLYEYEEAVESLFRELDIVI